MGSSVFRVVVAPARKAFRSLVVPLRVFPHRARLRYGRALNLPGRGCLWTWSPYVSFCASSKDNLNIIALDHLKMNVAFVGNNEHFDNEIWCHCVPELLAWYLQ